jgi:protoheme IX farnesyltransferase
MLVTGSILLSFCGPGPMLLGLLCVFLYNIIYTQLKLITSLAIIPGAITGAIPPIIGFTAAGGTVSDQRILIFSGFMFLWQLPHFWLLLIRYNEDFVKAGIKTIANFVKRKNIPLLVFSWVLLTSVYIVLFFGFSDVYGNYFSKIVLIANPVFIIYFYRQLFSSKKPEYLSGAFFALNAFSILLMLSLMADSLIKLS